MSNSLIYTENNLSLFNIYRLGTLAGRILLYSVRGTLMLIRRITLFMIGMIGLTGCSNVNALFKNSLPIEQKTCNESMIKDLPDPVRRYFRFALKDGQPYLNYLSLKHSGSFKTGPEKEWMEIIYLFGLLRIVNEKGEKIDQAELLRWLGESVWMPTNLLADEYKKWSAIDDRSAKLTFGGISVYYTVEFEFNRPSDC